MLIFLPTIFLFTFFFSKSKCWIFLFLRFLISFFCLWHFYHSGAWMWFFTVIYFYVFFYCFSPQPSIYSICTKYLKNEPKQNGSDSMFWEISHFHHNISICLCVKRREWFLLMRPSYILFRYALKPFSHQ